MDKQTQCGRIEASLLSHDDVCQRDGYKNRHGMRIAAHIHRLRVKGWPIKTKADKNGEAHYSLPEDWEPPRNEKAPTGKKGLEAEQTEHTGGSPDA